MALSRGRTNPIISPVRIIVTISILPTLFLRNDPVKIFSTTVAFFSTPGIFADNGVIFISYVAIADVPRKTIWSFIFSLSIFLLSTSAAEMVLNVPSFPM